MQCRIVRSLWICTPQYAHRQHRRPVPHLGGSPSVTLSSLRNIPVRAILRRAFRLDGHRLHLSDRLVPLHHTVVSGTIRQASPESQGLKRKTQRELELEHTSKARSATTMVITTKVPGNARIQPPSTLQSMKAITRRLMSACSASSSSRGLQHTSPRIPWRS